MSEISDYVRAEVERQKAEAVAEIQRQKGEAESYLNKKETDLKFYDEKLFNEIEGFRIGALAPAYITTNAGVKIRDANLKQVFTDVVYKNKPASILTIIGAAALIYYFWKGK